METRDSEQLAGKRSVLVTGGTRGIGRAIADAIADAGCDIVVTGLEQDEVDQTQLDRPDWDVRSLDLLNTSAIDAFVTQLVQLDVHVCGALVYYDENDRPVAHDDVHTKIEMCKQHFESVGLGADYVKQFIR